MQANWLLVFLILILILSLAMNGSKAAAEVNSSLAVGANLQRDHETKQVGEPQSKLSQLEIFHGKQRKQFLKNSTCG